MSPHRATGRPAAGTLPPYRDPEGLRSIVSGDLDLFHPDSRKVISEAVHRSNGFLAQSSSFDHADCYIRWNAAGITGHHSPKPRKDPSVLIVLPERP